MCNKCYGTLSNNPQIVTLQTEIWKHKLQFNISKNVIITLFFEFSLLLVKLTVN